MIGGMTHISNDVPAYMIVSGRPATVRSVNTIGLERRGFDKESIAEIREAFKILYKRNYSLQEAIDQIRVLSENCAPGHSCRVSGVFQKRHSSVISCSCSV